MSKTSTQLQGLIVVSFPQQGLLHGGLRGGAPQAGRAQRGQQQHSAGVGAPGTPESFPTWCELRGRIPTAKYNFKVSGPCLVSGSGGQPASTAEGAAPHTTVLGAQQTQPAPRLWVTTVPEGTPLHKHASTERPLTASAGKVKCR